MWEFFTKHLYNYRMVPKYFLVICSEDIDLSQGNGFQTFDVLSNEFLALLPSEGNAFP
jgi:hypothetical protein